MFISLSNGNISFTYQWNMDSNQNTGQSNNQLLQFAYIFELRIELQYISISNWLKPHFYISINQSDEPNKFTDLIWIGDMNEGGLDPCARIVAQSGTPHLNNKKCWWCMT